jgi:hypothetical protein
MKRQINLVAALGLGFALGIAVVWVSACSSPASPDGSAKYSYLHFTAGDCSADNGYGRGVIDLRNGKVYCVPYDGSEPVLKGALNLAAIPIN